VYVQYTVSSQRCQEFFYLLYTLIVRKTSGARHELVFRQARGGEKLGFVAVSLPGICDVCSLCAPGSE
jgi:hypothetical protein